MIAPADLAACRRAIRQGSRSFYAASHLLPARVRDPALALYAFCRLADDTIDEAGRDGPRAVASLYERLDRVYSGRPRNEPAERAFSSVVTSYELPRAVPEALLEGFSWDVDGRRYRTLSDLRAYCARVASTVGVMMCALMGVRGRDALARAADLGVAMQLTNIARDVAEDAAAGRVYLPLEWLEAAEIDVDSLTLNSTAGALVAPVVRRLLEEAESLYSRGQAGVAALPAGCRPGILAARHIYSAIGRRVLANGEGLLQQRARTSGAKKLALTTLAMAQAAGCSVMPRSAVLHAPPLPETVFLVEAVTMDDRPGTTWGDGSIGIVIGILAQLKAQDRGRSQGLAT